MPASSVHRLIAWIVIACMLPLALGAQADRSAASEDALLERYLALLNAHLDERAVAALQCMDGPGRRLLAARSYLRSASHLAERWSWSQQQIDAYQGSPEQALLEAEIGHVRAAFEAANPGFTLHVNPQVRSLEIQLDQWNRNDSVAAASETMRTTILAKLRASDFPRPDETGASTAFSQAVLAYEPAPTAPLAAPGLSLHGRMDAVDFQVAKGGELVARASMAEVAAVWDALGWREKLQDAVRVAGGRFSGPLQSPDEPWHYDFTGVAR